MKRKTQFQEVYSNITRLLKSISDKAPFSLDENLGYITTCPENLGSAFNVEAKIMLKHLCGDRENLMKIACKYNLKITPLYCSHIVLTKDDNEQDLDNLQEKCTFILSNIQVLGRSMANLVRDFQDGVQAILKREFELTPEQQHCDIDHPVFDVI